MTHECVLQIAADHPALPGHFPGAPLVPGVVLVDHVVLAAEQWLGQALSVAALTQAKFNAPLLPAQMARIRLQLKHRELRFSIVDGNITIAQGVLQLAREPATITVSV
jgi:3-hydroxymyristoyl/3-hydroxydecanoyl-(acyl carrier protein) dehydratase